MGITKCMNGQAVKKPIKINFYEWDGNKIPFLFWVDQIGGKEDENLFDFTELRRDQKTLCCIIKTSEENHLCCPGDIIIHGVNGGYYSCKREIFNKSYDIDGTADHRLFGATIIVSAFPGCGKSYCAQYGKSLIAHDSDSSNFHFREGTRESNPDWPQNYIQHIKRLKSRKYYDVIFISSHAEIRQALKEAGLQYLLVYPEINCKEEYLRRYLDRGSPMAFVERLEANWENWLQSCLDDDAFYRVLSPGTFLTEDIIISAVHPGIIDSFQKE
jgi:hypothetical protein